LKGTNHKKKLANKSWC